MYIIYVGVPVAFAAGAFLLLVGSHKLDMRRRQAYVPQRAEQFDHDVDDTDEIAEMETWQQCGRHGIESLAYIPVPPLWTPIIGAARIAIMCENTALNVLQFTAHAQLIRQYVAA